MSLGFREALARFPAGVTIVTTVDHEGRQWGFTASSFCSVSIDPPLVLVCLDRGADCHGAFMQNDRLAINVLAAEHQDLALRFATKGSDKFEDGAFVTDRAGLPVLSGAVAVLRCSTSRRIDGGDHVILLAEVEAARHDDGLPIVYHRRAFHRLADTRPW